MSNFARALEISPQQLYKYSREKDPWTLGPAMREKLRSVGLILDSTNKVQYTPLEENAIITQLREELEKYKAENDAFRRNLASEVVEVILQTAKHKDPKRGKVKTKLPGKA